MLNSYFQIVLVFHSWNRWAILLFLITSLVLAKKRFPNIEGFNQKIKFTSLLSIILQWILGTYLYFTSPISNYFMQQTSKAIHVREIRFFGLEHITVMNLAIGLIIWGYFKSNRQTTKINADKTIWVYWGIGLILILSSIPWSFSPLISRPLFR